jgi:hypothetical protein
MKFELNELIITAHDGYIYVHRAGTKSWKDGFLAGSAGAGVSIEEIVDDAERLLD